MNHPENPDRSGQADETELSPEAAAIIVKARRSAGLAIGVMLLGFMAIGAALVYRALRDSPSPPLAAEIKVPAGAAIVSALAHAGTLQVTYRHNGETVLAIFDAASGQLQHSLTIGAP